MQKKELWIPKSVMTVTVDARGNIGMVETMTMELKPVTHKTGFTQDERKEA